MRRGPRILLKGLAWAAAVVVGLAILALGAVYALVGTESGSQWAVDRFLPEEVTVASLEGRLLGPLTLGGVAVRGEDGALTEVDRVHLDWRPGALAAGRVHVAELDVSGVRHTSGEDVEEEEVEELEDLPEIELPVDVEVERARVTDVRVLDVDGTDVVAVDELSLQADWRGSTVRVHELGVAMEEGSARLEGFVELAGDYALDVAVDWDARLPDQPPLAGAGTFDGSLADLRVRHQLERPTDVAVEGRARDVVGDLTWEAGLEIPRFDLGAWDEELAGHEAGLSAEAEGSLEEVEGRVALAGSVAELEGPAPGEVEADVVGAFRDDRVTLDELEVRMPDVGGRLAARGDVLLQDPLTLDVTGEWANLAWPPAPDVRPDVASPEGRFAVDGTLEDYTFEARMEVQGEEVPSGTWSVEGTGTTADAAVRVAGDVLDGRLAVDGHVAWDPQVAWDVAVEGDDLNPGGLHPDAAGVVAFRARSDGRLEEDGPHADVLLDHLEGEVDDESFEGEADVGIRGEALDVRALRVTALDGEWTASGTVDEAWDLEVEGDAPDLAVLEDVVEGIEGSLRVEARLTGPREEPRIAGLVEARDVSAFDVAVDRLDLRADVEQLGALPSEVELQVEGLVTPEASLAALELDARGTRGDHTVALAARGLEGAAFDLGLSGGLTGEAEDRWEGTLNELAILDWTPADLDLEAAQVDEAEAPSPALGQWVLEAPVGLHASAEGGGLETACLRDGDRAFCLGGEWAAGIGGDARVDVAELPLDAASPWLPDLDLEGVVGARAQATLDGEGAPVELDAEIHTSPGALRYRVEEDAPPVSRDFREIRVEATWLDEVLDADLVLDFVEEGDGLQGRLRAAGGEAVEDLAEAELEGELTGSLEDRGLAAVLVPELDDTRGVLSADLQVGGTVSDPQVFGSVGLDEAGATVIPAGIELQDVALGLDSHDGTTWELSGGARSGDGEVILGGRIELGEAVPEVATDGNAQPAWSAELTVDGEAFEAFNTSDARVVVTPALEARADGERVDLGGTVAVPEARITPGDMEGVRQPSPDVVVVGLPEEEEEAPPIAVHTEVTVELGDDVTIDAFGLTGRLTGSLTVEDGPDQVTTGRGELEVVDGEFTMYGQTLEVDRGRLVFADGPVDDPGLDIRVTREVDEVLVGLDVAGTASRPEGEVFAEPAMAEADALSYLILGRPVRTASPEEGDVLADAARSAGLAGAGRLAEQIGVGVLGLEEAYIDPGEGEGLEEAQLVVGAQVTPSIHVGYAFGLFEAGNILRVRYSLGRRWTIQTEAGEETGGDLFYTIER